MKLSELLNSKDALQRLIERELPIKIAYKLSKFSTKANDELLRIEEHRIKLVKKYGIQQGENIEVPPENIQAFQVEFSELLNLEADIEIQPVSIDDLGNVDISTVDLMALSYLIEGVE